MEKIQTTEINDYSLFKWISDVGFEGAIFNEIHINVCAKFIIINKYINKIINW